MIYYFSDNPGGFVIGKKFSIDKPCVTVMAAGMGGGFIRALAFRQRCNSKS